MEPMHTYESMIPYISNARANNSVTPQYRLWAEQLLARACMLNARHVSTYAWYPDAYARMTTAASIEPPAILYPFREWAPFWKEGYVRTPSAPSARPSVTAVPTLRVWKGYYDILSTFTQLQFGPLIFESKLKQYTELKYVENAYETILLKGLRFPKANQATPEVEGLVDQVMANWQAMCGPCWHDSDYGAGGKAQLGKSVLDVSFSNTLISIREKR